MKKIKTLLICAIVLMLTAQVQAQEVKNQSEIIRSNVSKGDYKIIADKYMRHGGVMTITNIVADKSRPNDHFEISFKKYPNDATESTRNEVIRLFADNTSFPVTYMHSNYEGNAKLQKAVAYLVQESKYSTDRFVFIDNYLFFLADWKNKDDYLVRFILENPDAKKEMGENKSKKKKKGGFFKKMKQGLKNASTGSKEKIEKLKAEVLQPYLDKATAKQKANYAEWVKVPKNKKLENHIADSRVLMEKAMKKYNDDILKSPEYQRMLAYHRWMNNNINVTVKNNSGRTIWVGSGKTAFITTKIESGSSSVQTCTSDMYYYYSDAKGSQGTKFYTGDSACGSSVTIN